MSAIWGAIGAIFLLALYRALKVKWPENYSDMRAVVDSASQKNGFVYLTMRIVPVYLVAIVVAAISGPSEKQVTLGLATLGILHLMLTNLRPSILSKLFRSTDRSKFGHIAFHFATSVLIAFVILVADWSWQLFIPVLPNGDELVQAFWTALILGVLVAFVQEITRYQPTASKGFESAKQDLGPELSEFINSESRRMDVCPTFIQSIILAECIQRPKWFRKLENLKGRFIGPGTYGVAQMSANEPIGDMRSIELLCEKFSGYYPLRSPHGQILQQLISAKYEEHNFDPNFVNLALGNFGRLEPSVRQRTETVATDGRGLIELLDIKRNRGSWIVFVSCVSNGQTLFKTTTGRDSQVHGPLPVALDNLPMIRCSLSLEIPIQISNLRLEFISEEQTFDPAAVLLIDLSDPWIQN